MYNLQAMNGSSVPLKLAAGDTLFSGVMVLRADQRFALFPTYHRSSNGSSYTNEILGRWTKTDDTLRYHVDFSDGALIAKGVVTADSVTFRQVSDGSAFRFGRGPVADPDILVDRGSWTLTVSGALAGSTTVTDAAVGQPDYIRLIPNGQILGLKKVSTLGPSQGQDELIIGFNPNLSPGTFQNDACLATNSPYGTTCVDIRYVVSQLFTGGAAGTLSALGNGVSVTVTTRSAWHVKLSMSGLWEWRASGAAPRVDTVVVNATFNAFRVR